MTTTQEDKRKHLQLLQDVVSRMAGNSFLLKGWSITLVTAVVGFSVTLDGSGRAYMIVVATLLVVIFWLLDAYYLSNERAYRKLYNVIREKNETEIDYNLSAEKYRIGENSWRASLSSLPFVVFYAPALTILMIASVYLLCNL